MWFKNGPPRQPVGTCAPLYKNLDMRLWWGFSKCGPEKSLPSLSACCPVPSAARPSLLAHCALRSRSSTYYSTPLRLPRLIIMPSVVAAPRGLPASSSLRAVSVARSSSRRHTRTACSSDDNLAGFMEKISKDTEKYKRATASNVTTSAPPGATVPPSQPAFRTARFGFVENAEVWNTRLGIIGFFSLLIVEGIANKPLLTLMGIEVGNGIDIGF